MAAFADRLRTLRKNKGLLQKHVAAFLEISERYYRSYEGGKIDPAVSVAVRLADFFDVSVDYLVGRVDAPLSFTEIETNLTRHNKTCQAIQEKTSSTFGDRIKELRKNKGLTQKQMAVIYGVNERNWQKYEGGNFLPNAHGLIWLADYFGVSLDYLVGRDAKPAG